MVWGLIIFDEGEGFTGDGDDGVGFGALVGEFGADAEFFHDVAEAVQGGVVGEVGFAGEFFDFFAGDKEGAVVEFFDGPGVFEGFVAEFDDFEVGGGFFGGEGVGLGEAGGFAAFVFGDAGGEGAEEVIGSLVGDGGDGVDFRGGVFGEDGGGLEGDDVGVASISFHARPSPCS